MGNFFSKIKTTDSVFSVFWMLTWAACFSTAVSLTKMISDDISIFTLVFVRLCFGLILILPAVLNKNYKFQISKRLPLHALRVILTSTAIVCTYYAYKHLPLAFVTSIGFTGPLVTVLLAILLLGDKVSLYQWFLVVLGYSGVLIIMHPGEIEFDIAVVAALMANLLASTGNILLKKLSATDSTVQILSHTNIGMLFLVGTMSIFFWTTPTQSDLFYMCLLGCSGTLSQFCYIQALKIADPSTVAPFEYSRLIFAVPIGYLFFAEIPTLWTFVGSLVIILSNTLLTLYEANKKKSAKKSTEKA